MVLPISTAAPNAGVDIADPFEMWYAVVDKQPTTAVAYAWPADYGFSTDATGSTFISPDPTVTWSSVRLGSPPGVTCAGDVELTALQVGTENTPTSKIEFTALPASENLDTNVFFVRPKNIRLGGDLPAGSIEAKVFVANWGTQVLDETFWRPITPTDPNDVQTNRDNIAPGEVAGVGPPRNDIHFKWAMPVAERCKYSPSTDPLCQPLRGMHQCILVQLSSTSSLVFRNQSVARNMDFVSTASPFSRTAEVSVIGLEPIADGRERRDVYLYVETVNMPAVVTSALPATDTIIVVGRDIRIVATRDTAIRTEWGIVKLARGDTAVFPTKDTIVLSGQSSEAPLGALQRAAATGRLTTEDIDKHAPTFRVHAFHTTGDTLTLNGVKVPVLEPQSSFGYWVSHSGEVTGWSYRLEGARLSKIAPNYYKIEVPNNGTTTLTTIIEAREFSRFAFSLHAGLSYPTGNFKNTHDQGWGATADLEYWLSAKFGIAALFGYHRFEDTSAAKTKLELYHGSGALEYRLTTGSPSIIVDAGGGYYSFRPGSSDLGLHAGATLDFAINQHLSLGVNGRAHSVSTSGSKTTFYAVQAGGRYRW